jgi:biopolymer transport protein ExbB
MRTLGKYSSVKWFLSIALIILGTVSLSEKLYAQDEAAAPAENAAAPADAAPADAAPADAAPADAAPAAPAGQPGAPAAKSKSVLSWTFEALGLTYTIAFLVISFVFLALVVMVFISARRDNMCPADLIQAVEENLDSGNVQQAAELVANDESFLGQVLTAGFSRLDKGYAKAVEGMQEVGEEETMKLDHRLSYIALVGNISPMVGLLGTVDGMVRSFQVIATSGSTPKPAELAAGISTALITTLVGLIIAIPAIAFFNIMRNRQQLLILEIGNASERIISRFEDKK